MRPPQGEQNNAALSSKKRRTTNDKNSDERGGSYRKFDADSLHARKVLIESYAALYIAHLDGNSGKCKRGFMQGLVEKASRIACSLEITRDDIYNEVRRVQQKNKAMENILPTVSPVMFGETSPPNDTGFKWNVQKLTKAIRCKTLPGDAQRPTTKEALLLHWKKIQNRPTPQPSPVSSDDEDSTNECASDEEEDHHGVTVFGDDDMDFDESNADDVRN